MNLLNIGYLTLVVFDIFNMYANKKPYYLQSGFTLIELLVIFSIIGILAIPAVVSYNSYKNSQTLSNAALDMKTYLQLAESRSSSQIRPTTGGGNCNSYVMDGYAFKLCSISGSQCKSTDSYEVDIQCNGKTIAQLAASKSLPAGVTLQTSPLPPAVFQFPVLGGSITTGSIVLQMGAASKTITVSGNGVIKLQ